MSTKRRSTSLSLPVPLPTARFVVALLLFAFLIGDVADEFAVRHGSRVLETDFAPGATVIDVAEPEALYRVAERLDGLVLPWTAKVSVFSTYRCVVRRSAAADGEPMTTLPPVPAAAGLRNRFA